MLLVAWFHSYLSYYSYGYLADHFTIAELTQLNYFQQHLHGLISNEHLKNPLHIVQEFYGLWHELGLKLLLLNLGNDFFWLILFSVLHLLASSFTTIWDTWYFIISFPKHFSPILLQLFRFLLMSYLFSICLMVYHSLLILIHYAVAHYLPFIQPNSQFWLTNVPKTEQTFLGQFWLLFYECLLVDLKVKFFVKMATFNSSNLNWLEFIFTTMLHQL